MSAFLRGASAAVASLLISVSLFAATQPWDDPPFSSDPKALLAAAESVTPKSKDEGVVVLLDESRVTFDAKGLATRTERLVYRVVQESAVEGWASIEEQWQPWYDEQPKVEARVIAKDGSVHLLDPKSFKTNDAEDEPDMFSDARVLSGPLPAVAPGAVVEQLVTYKQKNTLYEAGTAHRHNFGRWVETQQSRLVIEYPSASAFHLVNHTTPEVKPARSEANGVTRLVFEAGNLPKVESGEYGIPSDVVHGSYVAFSTGKSWQDVATRYAEIVDKQAGPPDAIASLVKSVAGDAKTPREIAARFLEKVERDIRYAGVEFGEGSIVPRTPGETIAHKYGDCKDKAILLVAMLRQAGVPANAVLLDAGYGNDVEADLPGLGHFNHVIVYVRGESPLWIDPTDDYARAGELPDQDQGRRALIASRDTTALVVTPMADANANRTVETREFTLAEDGRSTMVVTHEYFGREDRSVRRYYATSDMKAIREQSEKYVKDAYLAEALGKFDMSDAKDLSKPFRTTMEALRAKRGLTSGGEAAVAFFERHLLGDMPAGLRSKKDDDDEEETATEAAKSKKPKKREHDYEFQPFVFEVHNIVHPPPGYALRTLPKSETLTLGTTTFTKEFKVRDDGIFEANYRFDSGPRRITAQQYEATKEALSQTPAEGVTLYYWDQLGHKYAENGDVGKAIAEFRRMEALHPNEALHHIDVAHALLEAGFGTLARAEAKKAIDIEPKSAKAHQMLGLALTNDLVGRDFGKGFDLEGAIRELRKAKELDPKDIQNRAELATVLQYSAAGDRYGTGAHLADAVAEYVSLKKEKGQVNEDFIDREIMMMYVHTQQFKELKELVAKTKDTEKKDAMSLVAVTALEGSAAGIKASEALELTKRRPALSAAGATLLELRRYPEATELLSAAAQGAPNAAQLRAQLEIVRRMKRIEDVPQIDAPQGVFRDFISALATSDEPEEAMKTMLATGVEDLFADTKTTRTSSRRVSAKEKAAMKRARGNESDRAFIADAALAAFQLQQDGTEETGYRLLARSQAGDTKELTTFVVRENGKYRIAGVGDEPQTLGYRALKLADNGKVEAARQWLDWARDYVHSGEGDDPVATQPFTALWTRGKQSSVDDVRLAAASLIPRTKKSAAIALPILLAQREKASSDQQWRIDQALSSAYQAMEKWDDMLTTADRLAAKHAHSEAAFRHAILPLLMLDRTDEARKRAEARLAELPNDRAALRALGEIATHRGDYTAALDAYRKTVEAPEPSADDYNAYAWTALFAGGNLDAAIEEARHADGKEPDSYPILNTLAVLYAEQGKSAEARETLLKSLEASPEREPRGADWYVVGRIAENYGISDAAIDAYKRIQKPDAAVHASVYELAQKRLAGLK
jgi:tetratricopeptide (TPR) repeat protein